MIYRNELKHYGVLGMRWGKRKTTGYKPRALETMGFLRGRYSNGKLESRSNYVKRMIGSNIVGLSGGFSGAMIGAGLGNLADHYLSKKGINSNFLNVGSKIGAYTGAITSSYLYSKNNLKKQNKKYGKGTI